MPILLVPLTADSKNQKEAQSKLEAQLAVIAELEEEQQMAVRLLDELYLTLEEDMWLTSFQQQGKKLEIQGKALSFPIIAEYLRNLEKSECFNNVEVILPKCDYKMFGKQYSRGFLIRATLPGCRTKRQKQPQDDERKDDLSLAERKLKEALKKFLEEQEIPGILDQINDALIDTGFSILLFQPEAQVQKEFYSEIPVRIQVSGGYHDFAVFADVVSKMEHVVALRDLAMLPQNEGAVSDGSMLQISCTLVTFRWTYRTI